MDFDDTNTVAMWCQVCQQNPQSIRFSWCYSFPSSLCVVIDNSEGSLQVLDLRNEILGERHPDTLTSMNDLAKSLRDLGRHKEAADMQEKVFSHGAIASQAAFV